MEQPVIRLHPLSTDPFDVSTNTWQEILTAFGFERKRAKNVYETRDGKYAVKIIPMSKKELSNEMSVSLQLNDILKQDSPQIFGYSYGYITSQELPPGINVASDNKGYVYLFSKPIRYTFDKDLPNDPKINEEFYFEILIGLYYIRKTIPFTHYDVHSGQLMFNYLDKHTLRKYKINNALVVSIRSNFEPKLIDYDRAMIGPKYTDDNLILAKKMWDKSDILHLSRIFIYRNITKKFENFLQQNVIHTYGELYPTKPGYDSGAKFENIEALLQTYFGKSK